MTNKGRFILAAALVLLFASAAYYGMGGVVHRGLERAAFRFLLVPILVLEVLIAIYRRCRGIGWVRAVSWLTGTAVLTALVWATIPVGRLVQSWEVGRARGFPQLVEPVLEEYHKVHGGYPDNLELIQGKPPTPRLLTKGRGVYILGYDGSYRFSYKDPDGPLNWHYDSTQKQWEASGD